MNIGVRLHDYGKHTPEELAKYAADGGFTCAQLAMQKALTLPPETFLQEDTLLRVRSTFESKHIALPVLGCYVNIVTEDTAQYESGTQKFCDYLAASVTLGAGCVGTETTPFAGSESAREEAYRILLRFTLAACETAERVGATVGIEAVARHTLNTPKLTRRLLDDVASDRLRVIFDLGNLLTPDNVHRQEQLLDEALSLYGDKICAVHIKDLVFDGEKPVNCRLGTGVVRWQYPIAQLNALNSNLCMMREGLFVDHAAEEFAFMKNGGVQ